MKCLETSRPDAGANRDRRSGIDQPLAQIHQVFEKRHASAGVVFGGRQDAGIRLSGVGHLSLSRVLNQDGHPDAGRFHGSRVAIAQQIAICEWRENLEVPWQPFRVLVAADRWLIPAAESEDS